MFFPVDALKKSNFVLISHSVIGCEQLCTISPTDEKYDDFLAKLKAAERDGQGRYAVYDCDYDPENKQKSKLVFIMW